MIKKRAIFLLFFFVNPSLLWGVVPFDISNVSYEIDSKLDDQRKTLNCFERITFETGEKSCHAVYFYVYQRYNIAYFLLDSAKINEKPVTFSWPDSTLLFIFPKDSLPSNSRVEVTLSFTIKFGDNLETYNAAYEDDNFYCGECYPKLAEFDLEGAILPDTITPILPVEKNKTLACGTKSFLPETYLRMADYRLKITLPAKFKIITSGEFKDTLINSDGTKTHIYEAKKFPGIVWVGVTNRELLIKDFEDFKVCCYYPPANRRQAEEMMNKIREVTKYYSEKFGPFPRSQLKILLMNMPSFLGGVSANDILFLPSGGGITDKILSSKMVLPHEVSHQWWGNAIPCGTGPEGWFAEALASYSAELFCSDHKDSWPDKNLLGDFTDKSALWLYITAARADQDESLRGSGVG
jgi:hypothetical protein